MAIQGTGNPVSRSVDVYNLTGFSQPIGRQQEDFRSQTVPGRRVEAFPFPGKHGMIHIVMGLQHFKQMHGQQGFRIPKAYCFSINFFIQIFCRFLCGTETAHFIAAFFQRFGSFGKIHGSASLLLFVIVPHVDARHVSHRQ